MAKVLPLDYRLGTAGQLVLRARIFYDIWRYFEGTDTRPTIIDAMRCYSEFFRFAPHAHFVAFVVYIAAVYEKKRADNISLPGIAEELKRDGLIEAVDAAQVEACLKQSELLSGKVIILRHKLFAHRSAQLSYAEVFEMAAVTSNDLGHLTEMALTTVNGLLGARGLKTLIFNAKPLGDAEAMLRSLERREV